ncbi:MAG: FAD:protein FMN transferase [Pseudomonadota bacterium]
MPVTSPRHPPVTVSRRAVLVALASAVAPGCRRASRTHHFEWLSFATTVRLTLTTRDAVLANEAAAAVQRRFAQINRDWYAWGDGELGDINTALMTTGEAPLSAEMADLLCQSKAFAARSAHRFDPAVGPLVKLWGFDRFDRGTPPSQWPTDKEIDAALRLVQRGFDIVSAPARAVRAASGSQIDLGGIAKGAALQAGLDTLAPFPLDGALLDAGGDIATLAAPRQSPYRIGLQVPAARTRERRAIPLQPGECIMTSGDYARYWANDDTVVQHIIDPRTGRPATGPRWATVIADDPLLADATATALMVADPGEFYTLCDVMQVSDAMIAVTLDEIRMTDALQRRLTDA